MGLSRITQQGSNYPIITCDACGKPIKDIRRAIITFSDTIGKPVNYCTGMYHKGECDPGDKMQPHSQELETSIQQLIWNLGIGKKITDGHKWWLVVEMSG